MSLGHPHDQLLEPLIGRLRWQSGNWVSMCSLNDAEDNNDSSMMNLTLNQAHLGCKPRAPVTGETET